MKKMDLKKGFEKCDTKFIVIITICCIIITSIPYIYGYVSAPGDKVFMGLVGRDVPGAYMYFMWETQSQEGKHLFIDRLTPEKHKPFYFNLEWWLLGNFLRYSGMTVITGFHVERCLTVFLAVATLYYFLTCFFQTPLERRSVLLLVIFTTGLGWLFWIISQWTGASPSIRLWDIEGINLFGYLTNKPHFIRSIILICLTYAFLLKGEEKQKVIYFFLAGLTLIIQGSIRPYNLPTAFLLFTFFPILLSVKEGRFTKRRLRNYLALILTSLPIVIYYMHMRFFSIFKEIWGAVSLRPLTPLELVIWLGLPFLIALFGFDGFRGLKQKENGEIFLYIWGVCLLILIYSYPIIPWGMESAGPFYILAPILAGKTVFNLIIPKLIKRRAFNREIKVRTAASIIILIIILSFPSNVILLKNTLRTLSHHALPYYLPKHMFNAFEWLRQYAHSEDVVLSASDNGIYLPVISRVKAFSGHPVFTKDFSGKNKLLTRFFNAQEKNHFRRAILRQYEVSYIFYSRAERTLGSFNPKDAPFLRSVYENPEVVIYKTEKK